MNANIILGARQPDLVNALAGGQELRARQNQLSQQNVLNAFHQEHGAGILDGDKAALQAYARIDPAAAVAVQGQHQIQKYRAQRSEQDLLEQQMRVEAHIADMDAAEIQREVEMIRRGVSQAIVLAERGDLDGVNRKLMEAGRQPIESLDEFSLVVAEFLDGTDAMEAYLNPPQPADEYGRYAQEERAAGRTPLSRINYAQAKKGSGVSVTTADGTSISFGGAQQGPGFGTKATNEIEGRILDSGAMLGRLNDTRDLFKPEYLEFETRLGAKLGQWMDKAGRATPEQQELVATFAQFKTEAFNNLNTSLKELSGAAVTPQEAERLLEQLPSVGTGVFDGDSPVEFQAKLEQSITQQKRAIARYNLWLATGRQGKPWEMSSLDDIDKLINQRGEQIEKELRASGITDPGVLDRQVTMQLRKEVGI